MSGRVERQWGIVSELGSAPKIALLRGGGLGDFLSTTAALRALRDALPSAQITLVTSPFLADFVHRYRAIDRVVAAPAYPGVIDGVRDHARQLRFFREMRDEHFDLAVQWHGGGRNSNPFVRRIGARMTAGFKAEDAEELDYWIPYDLRQHEVLRYFDLLRLLGVECGNVDTCLPVLPSDFEELSAVGELIDLNALREGRYVGIHASAGGYNRRWRPERFAWVADQLLDDSSFEGVLVTAGPGQEPDSAAVVEGMRNQGRAIDLGGRISLGALVALISKLGLFISNDSGPSHMAVALGTPSVAVFGAAHPLNWAPLNRTWHRAVAVWDAPCRWAVDDGCPNSPDVECLLNLEPSRVLGEARQLLQAMEKVRAAPRELHGRSGLDPGALSGGGERAA